MKRVALAVAALVACAPAAASAAITTYTLHGDYFGDPGTLIFQEDSTRGAFLSSSNQTSHHGNTPGTPSNPISSSFTFDGKTYEIADTDLGSSGQVADYDHGQGDEELDIFSQLNHSATNANFYAEILPGAPYSSYVDFYYADAAGTVQGILNNISYTVSVSAAPEPGTWILLLAGVGGIGLALRARRSGGVTASAPSTV